MEELFGEYLLDDELKQVKTSKLLENKFYVLVYFGAHWAPACRLFTQ